ncbi:hypothetical protein [Thiomicrorhabdus sediminis]|uniref:Uncharacterized protein n=1 Tax=Thiomicrorhabdus sediminis TaxID=2580412 RepID=A0A4P9K913_9GAMM|nr:hypothetical protein [Thiomicrorhabdus sediminis]QCU90950.1 hypothetical protein FE785_10095 [Thiomicrorhabdus sediminis]
MKNNFLNHCVNWRILVSRFAFIFLAMFLFAQTEGIVHAEIHHFHEHEASCDIFENLAQPFSPTTHASFADLSQTASDAYLEQLVPLFHKSHVDHFFGRAPPAF